MPNDTILIGVDGGASEVRAHEVSPVPRKSRLDPEAFALGAASASFLYDRARGFRPVPMPTQLLASERGKVEPTGIERAQGRLWVEAAAHVVQAVASQAGGSSLRLGICMPGLKTRDGRGISVMKNGPRIPDFLDRLEGLLGSAGLRLAQPISRISSDGEACAFGEEASSVGALRGVGCAYSIGGGTGLAEALKVDGRILGFDALRGFLRKAWQIESQGRKTIEDLLSPRGMNAIYAQTIRRKLPLEAADFPERRAAEGDEHAREVLRRAAEALADLVVDRMLALRRGFLPAKTAGSRSTGPPAPVRIPANTILERVVIGQRLGQILADPAHLEVFRIPAEEALARKIVATGDGALRKHYLDGSSLRPGLLHPSLLRAAPALGALAIEVLEANGKTELSDAVAPPPF